MLVSGGRPFRVTEDTAAAGSTDVKDRTAHNVVRTRKWAAIGGGCGLRVTDQDAWGVSNLCREGLRLTFGQALLSPSERQSVGATATEWGA